MPSDEEVRVCRCACPCVGECACEWSCSCEAARVSGEWVVCRLRESRALVLDLRGAAEFAAGHVRHAVHLSVPAIMLRRLAAGKLPLPATVPAHCRDLRARLAHATLFVLYGEPAEPLLRRVLLKRLRHDGATVVCLEGDFEEFRQKYPEWCSETATDRPASHLPLMGLRSLRISGGLTSDDKTSSGSSSDFEDVQTRGYHISHQDFPVEILPNLFLGNSANSEDCEGLARHNIKYVLNVTPDLPNVFESIDGDINYLKIPIADHWSQNLATHFPQAIKFIEEGVSSNCGVLVHCVAGISRSVTVTVAYLMQCHRLSLDDAFTLVRSRKADVAPNFHFMRQLHGFERDLGLDVESRSLSKVGS
ncbi:mitogen-activated protein kinase phosphatase 3 isoform X2 [Arctopsyche grandis]|uniref:mitogen-activated protein kinase phosphatase 3 isoform X2 n=1 Tax=Arctopsyche grandis TaxID=121162 RepID=UPI00406D69C7